MYTCNYQSVYVCIYILYISIYLYFSHLLSICLSGRREPDSSVSREPNHVASGTEVIGLNLLCYSIDFGDKSAKKPCLLSYNTH